MNILLAYEESQTATIEFRKIGHRAYSCNTQHCSGGHPEWHYKGNVLDILSGKCSFITESGTIEYVDKWDMMIAHPPCTMLARSSSVAYHKGKHSDEDIEEARKLFLNLLNAPIKRICIENPIPMKRANLPPYNQIIQPYEFGDDWTKITCLWLKNLPPLIGQCYASIGQKRNICPSRVRKNSGSKARSKSFKGIAKAMANQWGYIDE